MVKIETIEWLKRYFARKDKKPFHRQISDILRLIARYRSIPWQYLFYELYQRDVTQEELLRYVSEIALYKRLCPIPNNNGENHHLLLNNKIFFKQLMMANHVPVADTVLSLINGTFYDVDRSLLSRAEALNKLRAAACERIFLKYESGSNAANISCLTREQRDGSFYSGKTRVDMDFLEHLSGQGNHIFEQGIVQHPLLSQIHPSAVNTFRVITLFVPGYGPKILFCTLRMGRGNSVFDNLRAGGFSSWTRDKSPVGGLCAKVRVETRGLDTVAYDFYGNQYKTHPDTGALFEDQSFPFMNEILETCIHAANAIPTLKAIGWDITYSENGPVMIEGNYRWGLTTIQYPNGGIADIIEHETGIRF